MSCVNGLARSSVGAVIDVHLEDGIGHLTLNRPARRNAVTAADLDALSTSIYDCVETGAQVIILTGAGGHFCAGADLREINEGDGYELEAGLADTALAIRNCPIPVIAAIEGACMGAGFELAVSADVRIAGTSAMFEIPAGRLGILYRPSGLAFLLSELGHQTVARLFLFNERIVGEAARDAGIVATVVADGSAADAATDLATRGTHLVTEAVVATKKVLRDLADGVDRPQEWDELRRSLWASRRPIS